MPPTASPTGASGYELISVLLAIGCAAGPIFFGFMMFKMGKIFLTKDEFASYKEMANRDRESINTRLSAIERNTSVLLQRTAKNALKDE